MLLDLPGPIPRPSINRANPNRRRWSSSSDAEEILIFDARVAPLDESDRLYRIINFPNFLSGLLLRLTSFLWLARPQILG